MTAMTAQLKQSDSEDPRRWLAGYHGEFYHRDGATRMGKTQHYGPLRVQRPFFPEGTDTLHLYLLHPPGGLVGGDHLEIGLNAGVASHVLMTTPSAGKVYRNESDLTQGQHVHIRVAEQAVVEYLPQENIVFDGANAELYTRVDIEGSGLFVGWEITCLGRRESQAPFIAGRLRQSLNIYHDGQPLFLDRCDLQVPGRLLLSDCGFQQQNLFGTFVINRDVDFDYADWQQKINGHLKKHRGGCVSITQKPGVLIARILGTHTESMRQVFEALWQEIRPLIINKPACIPRIWLT